MRSAAAMTSHGKSEMARPIRPDTRVNSRRQPAINFSEHSILRNLPEASISSISDDRDIRKQLSAFVGSTFKRLVTSYGFSCKSEVDRVLAAVLYGSCEILYGTRYCWFARKPATESKYGDNQMPN